MSRLMLNGQWLDLSNTNHDESWLDRANSFGDGLFETMFTHSGKIFLFDYHMQRLLDGTQRLGIALDEENLRAEVNRYLAVLSPASTYKLKLIVSRGSSKSGYWQSGLVANRILFADPVDVDLSSKSAKTVFSSITLSHQPVLAGIKHCNRLEQVLAMREAKSLGADEAFMFDADSNLVEAISANVFVFDGESLSTPAIAGSGVSGVMRRHVIELATQQGLACEIKNITLDTLLAARTVFLTNAISGIRFVSQCKMPNDELVEWPEDEVIRSLQGMINQQRLS